MQSIIILIKSAKRTINHQPSNLMLSVIYNVVLIACLLGHWGCRQLLDGIPVNFKLAGNVQYVPTSGVLSIPGYKLQIGFDRFDWIGIKFNALTSSSQYDILVVERADEAVGGYYETTVRDYFVSSGRQDKLISDSINNMDRHVTTYTNGTYFYLEMYRTKGDTQSEDWEGGEFVEICFLTSDRSFNQDQWTDLKSSCYGYDVSEDYFSIERGKKIGSMSVDGTSSEVYGGIQGPVLQLNLFWFCDKPTLSNDQIIIRIGNQIDDDNVGYDYHVCGSGDYFGFSHSSLIPDTTWNGYNDGICTHTSSAFSNKIAFSRNVYTNDSFDSLIYRVTEICMRVGSNNECKSLQFEDLYPIMDVASAFAIFESRLRIDFMVCMLLALFWALS